jgi:hypothetical protein
MSTLLLVSRCSLYPKITSRTCLIIRTRLPHGESLQNPFRKSSHNKYLLSSTFSCEKKYFDFFTTMDVAESWSNHAHAPCGWRTRRLYQYLLSWLPSPPSFIRLNDPQLQTSIRILRVVGEVNPCQRRVRTTTSDVIFVSWREVYIQLRSSKFTETNKMSLRRSLDRHNTI